MRKLRRLVYLSLLGTLGTLTALMFPEYFLLIMIGASVILFLAKQLNFYKIAMMLKRLVQNARKMYLANRLKLRTGFRAYSDSELENSSRRCL
jgi:hypothetical protein